MTDKHTPIPEDLKGLYQKALMSLEHVVLWVRPAMLQKLIERIGSVEAERDAMRDALMREPTWKEMEIMDRRRLELNEDLSFTKAEKVAITEMMQRRAALSQWKESHVPNQRG